MPSPFRRSRVQNVVDPPPAINPISGKPWDAVPVDPVDQERNDEQFAAGQQALASAYAPGEHLRELLKEEGYDGEGAQARSGYDPRRSSWAGIT